MHDLKNSKNVFGHADDGFKRSVYCALERFPQHEGRNTMRKARVGLVAVVAILCIMITTTALAFANDWGILDFLTKRENSVELLPEAEKIVQTAMPQQGGTSEQVTFTVRDAVLDGQQLFVTVAAKPASPELLLLGTDAFPDDPVADMGPLFQDRTGTIAEYIRKNQLIPVKIWASVDNVPHNSVDSMLEEDGTLVCMLNARYEQGGADMENLTLSCGIVPFKAEGEAWVLDETGKQHTPLTVTLKNTGTQRETVTSTAPAEYSDVGVRVDQVTLTGTPMGIDAWIEYTIIDTEKYKATGGDLRFEFIDQNGERLPSGAQDGGGTQPLDDNGTRFVQTESLQAEETLPEKVILRGFNIMEKNRYEAHPFDMK